MERARVGIAAATLPRDGRDRLVSVRSVARSASLIGLGAGLIFWFASLTPTLVPRGWIVQGVTSGACLAIGYGIGSAIERTARRAARRPAGSPRVTRPVPLPAVVVPLVIAVAGMIAWAVWQDEARDLVGMSHLAWWEGPPMVLLSVVVAVALIWIGTAIGRWLRAAHRGVRRRVPAWLAMPAMVLLAVAFIGLVGAQMVVAANVIYEALDEGTNPGIDPPTLATVSGSPESLVAWDTMGLWGRDFAAGVTSRDQLLAYHGADADVRDPIRVFVGMKTADTIEERVAVAVRELERAGGFERSVIAVWVPGGSGWMDPNAARALEQLQNGDTAIVAVQYSYLPSFFSLVIDSSQAIEAGSLLFDAVHERWAALPEHNRPRLIVFGASLGASGAEKPFVGPDVAASVANFASRADGALIVGSLGWNPIIRQLTDARDPSSPPWQPVYADGETVRFATGHSRLDFATDWGPSRVLYLQHPDDPVAYPSLDSLWSPPAWMDEPRADGVPPDTGWFPIVSAVQAAADLSFAASLPSGFGHDYRVDYVDAFARIAPPEAWTDDDTARLEAYLDADAKTAAGGP
jgi:uncharacterized membrane protein